MIRLREIVLILDLNRQGLSVSAIALDVQSLARILTDLVHYPAAKQFPAMGILKTVTLHGVFNTRQVDGQVANVPLCGQFAFGRAVARPGAVLLFLNFGVDNLKFFED